jgi:hypothetical protein
MYKPESLCHCVIEPEHGKASTTMESGSSKEPSRLVNIRFSTQQLLFILSLSLGAAAGIISGCSGTNSTPATSAATPMAQVSIKLSDPATCMAPNGPFAHVYVSVSDVKAHVNGAATDNDPGFVDLTPGLSTHPQQIDLLGQATNQCFLATLGSTQQLQPGKYQQIRVILTDNSPGTVGKMLPNNLCSNGAANCVVLNDGTVHTLNLSSETTTGIKIPPGQIANGGISVAAGETKDLDIDFNTCVSIIEQGNGQFRLKPVLHAGEVTTTSTSINGTVVDSATGKAVNGLVLIALEQADANGVDRVFMNTLADASGGFVFCPLPMGTYDVVIVGEAYGGAVYAPTVVTGVSTGSTLSTVQLHAQPSTASGIAKLQGTVTSQNGATPPTATSIDVQVSALESVNTSLIVTVPQLPNQAGATLALTTESSSSCATGKDCVSYTMPLSASAPYIGAFSASGTTLTQSVLPVAYTMDGIAFVPSSGGATDCSPGELQATPVTPVAGSTLLVPTLAFTGCQ